MTDRQQTGRAGQEQGQTAGGRGQGTTEEQGRGQREGAEEGNGERAVCA
jgi:hypothetical protein